MTSSSRRHLRRRGGNDYDPGMNTRINRAGSRRRKDAKGESSREASAESNDEVSDFPVSRLLTLTWTSPCSLTPLALR